MARKWMLAVSAAMALGTAAPAASVPQNIQTAVTDPARPAPDTQRDALRKPAEMLAFADVKPGMKVMDLMPGGGYFTRLFAKAVEPGGRVYAYHPSEQDVFMKGKEPAVVAIAAAYKDVTVIHDSISKISAPEPLDLVWTSQNYHDLKNEKTLDTATVNKAVFNVLKPGGLYVVLDHSAEKGSGVHDTNTLHRIDEEAVKKEVLAAGFELAGESNALRNPADPRTAKVFDPAIRGRTDQFVLKFRKPLH